MSDGLYALNALGEQLKAAQRHADLCAQMVAMAEQVAHEASLEVSRIKRLIYVTAAGNPRHD